MAKGLYVSLACKLPDKAEIIEVGDIAELVYYRAIMRCRENLTDGVIDRRVISRWFAGIRGKPAAHLDRLQGVGLLVGHPDGWSIPGEVWREWNPTAAEVDAKRDAETERKRRWKEQQRDNSATASRQARDRQPESKSKSESKSESKPESKPESESSTQVSSSVVESVPAEPATTTTDLRIEAAINAHAAIAAQGAENPTGYAATVRTNGRIEHGAALDTHLTAHPDATAWHLAHDVLGCSELDLWTVAGWQRPEPKVA